MCNENIAFAEIWESVEIIFIAKLYESLENHMLEFH